VTADVVGGALLSVVGIAGGAVPSGVDELLLSGVAGVGGASLSGSRVVLGVGTAFSAFRWTGGAALPSVAVVDGAVPSIDGLVTGVVMLVAKVVGGAVVLPLEHCATVRTTAPQTNNVVAGPVTNWRTA